MKKSLIALAVLAASGASFAQSTVSIYGIADVYFGRTTSNAACKTSQTVVNSGGLSGSRFGFKGTEDLGGGLKANFVLEQGFSIDDGAAGTTTAAKVTAAFSRQAFVGFSGSFGEARIGKVFTAYDDISGATNAVFDSGMLAPTVGVWASTGYNDKANNAVYYATPTFSGFQGAVSYSLNEDAAVGVAAGYTTSLNGTYTAGPVYVGVAYQTEVAKGVAQSDDFTRVNASYDLGVAKLLAGYGRAAIGAGAAQVSSRDYQVGVDYPVSAALVLSGGVARSLDNTAVARTGYGFGAAYSLSKRTTVYGGYQHNTSTTSGNDTDASTLAAGVKHTF